MTLSLRALATLRAAMLLALAWLIVTPAAAQTFPKFTGLVVDAADVLPPETEAALTAKLEALQKDTRRQLVVATIADLQGYSNEEYGYKLGRNWGVGLRDVDNGVILFIAPNAPAGQRGARIEVGRGLEPVLTDALSSVIINTDMLPKLKAGDIPGGVTAGVDAIATQLRASPEEAQARLDAATKRFDATHRRSTANDSGGGVPFGLIIWAVILLFVLIPLLRGRKRAGPWGKRYRSNDGGSALPIVLWSIANEIGRSSGGGWSGGGGSGGGSDGSWGGGGFTGGGGGSFGGGGASGSW